MDSYFMKGVNIQRPPYDCCDDDCDNEYYEKDSYQSRGGSYGDGDDYRRGSYQKHDSNHSGDRSDSGGYDDGHPSGFYGVCSVHDFHGGDDIL
jgi:hypothetical protein